MALRAVHHLHALCGHVMPAQGVFFLRIGGIFLTGNACYACTSHSKAVLRTCIVHNTYAHYVCVLCSYYAQPLRAELIWAQDVRTPPIYSTLCATHIMCVLNDSTRPSCGWAVLSMCTAYVSPTGLLRLYLYGDGMMYIPYVCTYVRTSIMYGDPHTQHTAKLCAY